MQQNWGDENIKHKTKNRVIMIIIMPCGITVPRFSRRERRLRPPPTLVWVALVKLPPRILPCHLRCRLGSLGNEKLYEGLAASRSFFNGYCQQQKYGRLYNFWRVWRWRLQVEFLLILFFWAPPHKDSKNIDCVPLGSWSWNSFLTRGFCQTSPSGSSPMHWFQFMY